MDFLHGRDEGIWNFFQSLRRPLRDQIMLGITSAGSPYVLIALLIIAASLLMLRKKSALAVFLAASSFGAFALGLVTQAVVGRLRPQILTLPEGMGVLQLPITAGSFPSMWALLSTATYLALAHVGGDLWPARRRRLFRLAQLLVFLIGISRLYIGTCFPTDVIGGWLGGAAWMMLCRRVYERWTADANYVPAANTVPAATVHQSNFIARGPE
jgi:undecaprenyl-diphosphatase